MKKQLSSKQKMILAIGGVVLMLVLGIGIMVYPIVSSAYMETVRSGIQTQYQEQIAESNQEQLDEVREAAVLYNKQLSAGELFVLEPEKNGYFEQMLVPGMTKVMAYIHIPRIHIDLPVYHGVGNDALSSGCGHMPQSSLPVGGESTHAVISAHTGLANSAMFSDLTLLKEGDVFQIDVLGETLTYEIQSSDDIRTVLPGEVQAVQIKNGQDLCTLVTCTPIGVNTHRLLVTGHRIPTPTEESNAQLPEAEVGADNMKSPWKQEYLNSVKIGIAIMTVIPMTAVMAAFFYMRKKGKYERKRGGDNM